MGRGTRVIGYMVIECGATIQQATATDGEWILRVLFPDQDTISETMEFAVRHDLSLELRRLYDLNSAERVRFNLTQEQQEALVEGYERGYYTIPRDIDASDLAAVLDILHQAISERLRRATSNLIENTLLVDTDEDH